jgi:DNA-binding transcriptional MocR family regulator
MNLDLDKQGTLYEQIARALKQAILEGDLVAGSRLPSTRSLATALRVSRKPVIEAYELLCAEQVAVARTGSGTRVAKLILPRPVVSLRRANKDAWPDYFGWLRPAHSLQHAVRRTHGESALVQFLAPQAGCGSTARRTGISHIGRLPATATDAGGLPGATSRRHLRS